MAVSSCCLVQSYKRKCKIILGALTVLVAVTIGALRTFVRTTILSRLVINLYY